MLKAGIRLHGLEACDKVGQMCCALHNMMLEMDGLDSADDWIGADLGSFSQEDIELAVPFAIQRLHNPGALRAYDSSGNGRGTDVLQNGDSNEEEGDANEPVDTRSQQEQIDECLDKEDFRRVRLLSLEVFRSKLIENFDILFRQNKLKWPKSIASQSCN